MILALDFGVDPFAFVIALVALWIAFRESWRNNRSVVRVIECHISYRKLNGPPTVKIAIQNLGISLHNVSLWLRYECGDPASYCGTPFRRRRSEGCSSDEFSKGMIAEFEVDVDDMDFLQHQSLWVASKPCSRNHALEVRSQGYTVKSIPLSGGWRLRAVGWWNRFAHTVNDWMPSRYSHFMMRRGILPTFPTVGWAVTKVIKESAKRFTNEQKSRVSDALLRMIGEPDRDRRSCDATEIDAISVATK